MTRIGIAGIGFTGMIHYLASRDLVDARVSAICTRDSRKRTCAAAMDAIPLTEAPPPPSSGIPTDSQDP